MHRKHSLVGTQRIINLEDSWLSSVIDINDSKLGVIDTFNTVKTNFLQNLSSWLGNDIHTTNHSRPHCVDFLNFKSISFFRWTLLPKLLEAKA
jgi:hypothetical protein